MGGSPGRWTKMTAGTDDAGSRRRWNQKAGPAAVLMIAVLTMVACSSGTDPNLQTAPPKPKPPTTSNTANPKLPASTAATQHAVLNAWFLANQTLYAYMDEPPTPLRADLVAGQTTADLFPKLTDYYVDPALQSENLFLLKLKMQLLNGPTTYNLANPTVTALTPTTATVAFCTSDSGTTTASGQPGPLTLDGNDPAIGGVRGTSNLVQVAGSWKVASGQSASVAKC
jgi:hypothetical protein